MRDEKSQYFILFPSVKKTSRTSKSIFLENDLQKIPNLAAPDKQLFLCKDLSGHD
jgi:hypothetical protein